MSPLARRVAAAAVLLPAVVAAILWLPTPAFALVFGLFALLGAWEWPGVAVLVGGWRCGFWSAVVISMAMLGVPWPDAPLLQPLLLLAMLFWAVALVWVIQAQSGSAPSGLTSALVRAVAGWLTLVPCWLALVSLHALSPSLVLLVMVLIWIADSAAFFAGRRFGRRRLASRVSPGKSWEGAMAGLGAVAVAAWLVQVAGVLTVDRPIALVLLCVLVAAVSVLGDLNESLFKRRAGVKDSGTLIPGHGGVLDRIDSITAAAPAFSLGWLQLGLNLS